MNVYVTGSQGFTGKYLCSLLRQHYHVIEATADITDLNALKFELASTKPDFVVHLAALAFVQHHDQEALYRVNVFGTLNVLQALADVKHSPKKILIASSANVYGNPTQSPVSETVCLQPINHYANSKLAMENMVRTWFSRFPIIIARPFNYTGIGQSPQFLIPKLVSHYKLRSTQIELGNLDVVRDFSDVRWVVQCYLALLQSSFQGDVVNVCSGKGNSLLECVALLSELVGYTIAIQSNKELLRQNEILTLIGDNTKLKSIIGDVPVIPLKDTLSWMYNE